MKWAVPELRRINKPITFDEVLNLENDIVGYNGCKAISPVSVAGEGHEFEEGRFIFDMKIKCSLTLTCAITLEDIEYPMEIEAKEIFAFSNEEDEDLYLIQGQTIDLTTAIITNIIVNTPIKVVKEGAQLENDFEEEEKINPAFASLAEYLKK